MAQVAWFKCRDADDLFDPIFQHQKAHPKGLGELQFADNPEHGCDRAPVLGRRISGELNGFSRS